MIRAVDPQPRRSPRVVVVDIGNSSTSVGLWSDDSVSHRSTFATAGIDTLADAVQALAGQEKDSFIGAIAIASVVPAQLDRLREWVGRVLSIEPLVIGKQIPLPMTVGLAMPERVGVDRVCTAAAAYHVSQQATVIVDCGTAITVDAVDDVGSFIGGAILPGLALQAKSLHEHTAQLPEIAIAAPDSVIGTDTESAIRTGIFHGAAGAIRGLVEAYATHFGKWPLVVATGGDAMLIADACGVFDRVVADLCLTGVGLAFNKRLDDALAL